MTVSHALTQMKAKNLGPSKHFDGQGLMLVKQRKDAGKWILRLVIDGKRREMGLGRWPDVSVAEAREQMLSFDPARRFHPCFGEHETAGAEFDQKMQGAEMLA